ncbi:MAG: glycosyltransferase [Bacteroidales bacterium]
MDANRTVHALWIGNQLSFVEKLTIKSFIDHGFDFNLWLYNPLVTSVPEQVNIRDAAEIIPRHDVFNYKYTNQFGHGKGSFAGFSDIFRYKLLYEYGGWWTDMDVTCLKTPDFADDYVFRTHHSLPLVGNIMKVPPKSELMKLCYKEASDKITENNRDWHLPIQILADNVDKFGLSKYIRNFSNQDSWNIIRNLLQKNMEMPEHWYFIHWVNEEWRRNRISKLRTIKGSVLDTLLDKYDIHHKHAHNLRKIRLLFRLSLPGYIVNRYF